MKTFFKTFALETEKNNLSKIQGNLKAYVNEDVSFCAVDLTDTCNTWIQESSIQNGQITLHAMHTTCVLSVNEFSEPCLIADMHNLLDREVPQNDYLHHHVELRSQNLLEGKPDGNGDAHLKTFLVGTPTQSLIIQGGDLFLGRAKLSAH